MAILSSNFYVRLNVLQRRSITVTHIIYNGKGTTRAKSNVHRKVLGEHTQMHR